MGHQPKPAARPTGHHGPAQLSSSFFSLRAAQPAGLGPAPPVQPTNHTATPHLPPVAADERDPPVDFPLPPAVSRDPGSARSTRRSPRSTTGGPNRPRFPFSFSSFACAPASAPVTCQPRAHRLAPRQKSATTHARLFPPRLGRPRRTAAMPPRVPARTPRTPYHSRSQNPSTEYKTPSRFPNPSSPLFSPSAAAAPAEEEGRRRGGGAAPREGRHRTRAPPGWCPDNDVNEAAHPARPRPTCAGLPPLRVSCLRALGERRRRSLPSFSPVAGVMPSAANKPAVANPRTPSPIQPPCRPFMQEPVAPPLHPIAVASCRNPGMSVPHGRHGHAAALGSQDTRACVRTRTMSRAEPPPRCTTARPSHAPATALPCAASPRRGRDVPFATRPSPRTFPRTPSGRSHTHTLAHMHTGPYWPEPHRIWQPHQIRW
jgi:hypothetical protein